MSTRTRSRRTYGREPLQLSKLNPADVSMLPGVQLSIVCRDCLTWRRVVGDTDLRVIGHERGDGKDRCRGGNRQVKADLTPERWLARRRRQQQDALRAETRRPTTVLKKVTAPKPPALHQLDPAQPTADTARRALEAHRARCEAAACTSSKEKRTDEDRRRVEHCPDGERLARRYLSLLEYEPRRREAAAVRQGERERLDQETAAGFPKRRKEEWKAVLPLVKEADAGRAKPLEGARGPIVALALPVGARPIGQGPTAAEVLSASPVRKRAA
ncbi:hypothetical protein ABT093_24160 [Kitasatospora sp. NPDC002551]|uniref:hypothetical protein n=1 Tax=Kitasatospora sp. NPDC002551 TaxID=3154539 RepID=UPI00331E22C2